MEKQTIEHKGIVESIGSKKVSVRFTVHSACASCEAKSFCSISEKEDRVVEIPCDTDKFRRGDPVNMVISRSQGFDALRIGYVYPFILVFTALLVFSILGIEELFSGLISLSLLIPYFILIKFFNKNINKKFQFTLYKTES